MATSLGDLLDEIAWASRDGAFVEAADGYGAIAELGRAGRELASGGDALEPNWLRNVSELAGWCAAASDRMNLERHGQVSLLSGALADMIVATKRQMSADDRWTVSAEIAGAAHALSLRVQPTEERRVSDLAALRGVARTIIVSSVDAEPSSRAVFGWALPPTQAFSAGPAAERAFDAFLTLSRQLQMSVERGENATLLEVFAATRAAESAVRYAGAVADVLHGRAAGAQRADGRWRAVRMSLRPFIEAAPTRTTHPDLNVPALRTHQALESQFGRLGELGAQESSLLEPLVVQALARTSAEAVVVARSLARAVESVADAGMLMAIATQLPYREGRTDEWVRGRAIVADRGDVTPTVEALRAAAESSAAASDQLGDAAAARFGTPVDARQAALAARSVGLGRAVGRRPQVDGSVRLARPDDARRYALRSTAPSRSVGEPQ